MSQQSVKIEVKDEVKKFGKVVAVDHVSFRVKEGEILGLLGPSGCGKTTILRSIAGLEEINEGEIFLDGQVVTSARKKVFLPAEKRKLGFVFQSYALWPHMTVRENLRYCLQGGKHSKSEKETRIKDALDLVGLYGLEDRYPSQLSGGQQQRVALARNLAYHPKVLLLDEPLSNLDLQVRERVRGDLHVLLKKIGITSIFVTHDQEEAFVISDRTILLNQGKIVQEGSPHELYSRPASSFVAEFVGHANILKASLVEILPGGQTARLMIPDFGSELICQYDGEIPKEVSSVTIRYNEMGVSSAKPETTDNVVKGEIVSREYRGSVTDHKIHIGGTNIIVTTHKFCSATESPTGIGAIYVSIPPSAIKPLRS
ncbi:MAG: ABC transporter ATP-binding protein [Nitrososphaerales archaeon]